VSRTRDRSATCAGIVAAVGQVLARDGFGSFGVNAVAREAGVDKVLIYRYFGGLPELLRAFGEQGDFWPTDEELLEGIDPTSDHLAEVYARIAVNAVRGIRSRPLTIEILAWELVEQNEATRVLEAIRQDQWERLLGGAAGIPTPPEPVATAIAMSFAATAYLLARGRTIATYANLDLSTDEGWAGIEHSVAASVRCAAG
jgi:AcrR family transcriptional regulator